MMGARTFELRGLAEGLTGRSRVTAASAEAVFAMFPALETARHKLDVSSTTISGFAACDG